MTPKIDVVLDRFRQRGPLSSETDPGEDIGIEEPITLVYKSYYICNGVIVTIS